MVRAGGPRRYTGRGLGAGEAALPVNCLHAACTGRAGGAW
jgi:hypothetical protein